MPLAVVQHEVLLLTEQNIKGIRMYTTIKILLVIMMTCFTGGIALADDQVARCSQAEAIVPALSNLMGDELIYQEERVLRLCPDGKPGRLVKKWRSKRYDELQRVADENMAAGNDVKSIDAYRQMLCIDTTNSKKRYTLGLLYERQGKLNDAEEQFRFVVKQDPANGDARRRLADIYTLRGDFSLAINEYREVLKVYGDNPLLHFKLARAYERDGKSQEAISEYLESIKFASDNVEAHKELAALYLKKHDWNAAGEQYKAVLLQNNTDTSARNSLTAVYVKLRKHDELYSLIKEEVELYPDNPNSHFKLGLMYDFRKNYDAALDEYQKALALKSDHAKALNGMGRVYLETGKLKMARIYLEAAKKADPKQLVTHELLDNLRIEQARISAAKMRKYKALQKQRKKHSKKAKTRSKHKKKAVKSHKAKKNKKGHTTHKVKKRK